MVWLWVVVAGIAVGVPAGTWAAVTVSQARSAKSPRGQRPKLDRMDRWLYDRYPLGVMDRWRVRDAVFQGREVSEPTLRRPAHDFATALLAGQVGAVSRKAMWIMLGADGFLIAAVLITMLITSNYSMLSPVVIGLPLMALAARRFARDRQRIEQARKLNR